MAGTRTVRDTSTRTLIGIDHAFSFPIEYFQRYHLNVADWDLFLNDFQHYWPTDADNQTVHALLNGGGQNRTGERSIGLRATDTHAPGA